MKIKMFEIRDRATMFTMLCVEMFPDTAFQARAMGRVGYEWTHDKPTLMVTHLNGAHMAQTDPYEWGDRTFTIAHSHIENMWHELEDGDVIDVEHILGETQRKKESET